MRRFIEEADRGQWTLLPECLDDFIDESNPVRVIDKVQRRRAQHEYLLEAVQQRLDANPEAMRQRRETVEHPFGTMKARMGATHFLTKTLPKVAAEMALSVLAYNLTRVMNIVGVRPLIAALVA